VSAAWACSTNRSAAMSGSRCLADMNAITVRWVGSAQRRGRPRASCPDGVRAFAAPDRRAPVLTRQRSALVSGCVSTRTASSRRKVRPHGRSLSGVAVRQATTISAAASSDTVAARSSVADWAALA
jgi:hypothetical protein